MCRGIRQVVESGQICNQMTSPRRTCEISRHLSQLEYGKNPPDERMRTCSLPASTLLLENRTGALESRVGILVWRNTYGTVVQSLAPLEVHAVSLHTVRTSIRVLIIVFARPLCRCGDTIGGGIPLAGILRHGTRRLVRLGWRVAISGCTTSIAHNIVQIAGGWCLALRRWIPRVPLGLA